MILLATTFLALAAADPAPAAEDQITVVARRLETVSVWLAPDARGKLNCGMNQSSGDAGLDAQLCRAAARCLKGGATGNDAMKQCIDARKPALLQDFAARLRSGRS